MSVDNTRRFFRAGTLAAILGALGLSLGFVSWGLRRHYAYTKPPSPKAGIGRVYPLNTHGSIVYLNRQEQFLLYGLQVFAGLSFGRAVIIDVIRRQSRS